MGDFPVCCLVMTQMIPSGAKPRRKTAEPFNPHREDIEYGLLDGLVGYAVRRAQIRIYEDFTAALQPWAITPQRFSALMLIERNPGIKPIELARTMGIARSGVAIILDTLQAAGYVRRMGEQADKRTLALRLSAAGRKALADISAAVQAHDQRIAARLSQSEKDCLVELLGRLG